MAWVWIAVGGALFLGFYLGFMVMGILAAAATIARSADRRPETGDGSDGRTDLDLDGVGVGCGPGLGCGGDVGADGLACRGMRR